jgi:hypothetical protein
MAAFVFLYLLRGAGFLGRLPEDYEEELSGH